MAGDETADLRAEFQVADLAVLEEPHQTVGIVFENIGVGGEQASVPGDEPVEFLAVFFAECQERADAGFGAGFLLDLEGLHQGGGVLIDVARVAVVVAHERLGAAQDVALRVVEGGGDDSLQLEGELVGGLARVVVELVADAVEEIVGFLDFLESGGGEKFFLHEILKSRAAGFDAGDPLDVMIVAHAATALLDVGLLEENGAGVFLVAAPEVFPAKVEKGGLPLANALLGEAGLELGE